MTYIYFPPIFLHLNLKQKLIRSANIFFICFKHSYFRLLIDHCISQAINRNGNFAYCYFQNLLIVNEWMIHIFRFFYVFVNWVNTVKKNCLLFKILIFTSSYFLSLNSSMFISASRWPPRSLDIGTGVLGH